MELDQKDYQSYLLRLWRVKDDGDSWRASLQDVRSGKLLGFSDLEELFAYLGELLEQASMGHKPDQDIVAGQQNNLSDWRER